MKCQIVGFISLGLGLILSLLACQQVPTVVTTENKTILVNEPSVRKLVTEGTILVDARSPFEYGLSHIPGSINLQWQDFSISGGSNPGFLDADKFKLARRLALVGIDLETPVLILGLGINGDGSEGRLAWMFKYLGVQKVSTVSYDLLRAQMTQVNSQQPASRPIWKPMLQENYEITYPEFYTLVQTYQVKHHLPSIPLRKGFRVGRKIQGVGFFVLDVRKTTEKASDKSPEIRETRKSEDFVAQEVVIKVPWTQFWSSQGQVSHEAIQILRQHGVKPTDSIIVLSENGSTASGVVFALRDLGFDLAQVLAGGLSYLENLSSSSSSRNH